MVVRELAPVAPIAVQTTHSCASQIATFKGILSGGEHKFQAALSWLGLTVWIWTGTPGSFRKMMGHLASDRVDRPKQGNRTFRLPPKWSNPTKHKVHETQNVRKRPATSNPSHLEGG